MSIAIEKIPGGLQVDGIKLRKGKCGCTSVAQCCYSWSKVKVRGSSVEYEAKMTGPDTNDPHTWGYTVSKDSIRVTVRVEDARDKEIFSGYIPPPINEWIAKGWDMVEKTGDRADGTVWRCAMCKWLYKDDGEETPFAGLAGSWSCPKCGAQKSVFENISG